MNPYSAAKTVFVGVEGTLTGYDDLFTYAVPEVFSDKIQPGMRVLVPFGRGNRICQGFVFAVSEQPPEPEVKNLSALCDDFPLLDDELLSVAKRIHDTTFCTYFNSARAVLPGAMCLRTEKIYKLCNNDENSLFSDEKVNSVIALLKKDGGYVKESIIVQKCSLNDGSVLKLLENQGVIKSDTASYKKTDSLNVTLLRVSDSFEEDDYGSLSPKQQNFMRVLEQLGSATVSEVCYYAGVTSAVARVLINRGFAEQFEDIKERLPVQVTERDEDFVKPVLSAEQNKAFSELYSAYKDGKTECYLLFGVTGSGKTAVYLQLVDEVIADGRCAIVLVPEIALTAQSVALFTRRYGKLVAIMHSALSAGERHDEWLRIKNGEARVVVGTRSAVFAPVKNLGVIIIDEEQEHTYKSEMSPRYDAREIAKFRCSLNCTLLVLASATPSVETYAKAKQGIYGLCELPARFGTAELPDVIMVDTADKNAVEPYCAISKALGTEIERCLENREQCVLLVNRRGYNTFVSCRTCKNVFTCPNCSISLTYHSANNRLMCHYCGYSAPFAENCPVCGGENIKYTGFGTQRVENELKLKFPSARILRMDADTTTAKDSHSKAFNSFAAGEYDILLGTQMVAKGLDFPAVTLVGVVNADNKLYNDDFRSSEKTFDLITQVIGRAGRAQKKGRAVIQTVDPENAVLRIASKQDYKKFFDNEIVLRKAMVYPPFCDICTVEFSSAEDILTKNCAKRFMKLLENNERVKNNSVKIIVLGPASPRIPKINNSYRQRIIIKCRNNASFRELISGLLKEINNDKEYKRVSVVADINPNGV